MSTLKVNTLDTRSGTDITVTTGKTVVVPAGATITVAGTQTVTGAQTNTGTLDISGATVTLPATLPATALTNATAVPAAQLSGQVPLANLGNVDTTGLQDDIALLAFKTQANGSLARYNLVDQSVDAFEDASGVDASASTNEYRDIAGKYYRGGVSVAGAQTAFTTVGANTWTCPVGLTSLDNLLVVAGGGGGGEGDAGGAGAGGAGGLLYTTSYAVTASVVYDITVGAAGVGSSVTNTNGGAGGNSVWNVNAEGSGLTQTAVGGGGGGGSPNAGSAGGSGGGGGGYPSNSAGGSATQADSGGGTGFGYAGGSGLAANSTNSQGGGGGGAGAAAPNAASNDASDGGVGKDYSAVFGTGVGESGWFAGGGGGGSANDYRGLGGNGGGGNGSYNGNQTGPFAGHANTGGGAGGTSRHDALATGYNGGTGVVILKYGSFATYNNLTLVSNTLTAVDAVTKGDIVMTYTNGAGTAVVNTDLVASVSRDNGATYTDVTLVSQGTTGGHTILTAHDVTLGGTDTSQMRWKVTAINQSVSKSTRIHAVSLGWS